MFVVTHGHHSARDMTPVISGSRDGRSSFGSVSLKDFSSLSKSLPGKPYCTWSRFKFNDFEVWTFVTLADQGGGGGVGWGGGCKEGSGREDLDVPLTVHVL